MVRTWGQRRWGLEAGLPTWDAECAGTNGSSDCKSTGRWGLGGCHVGCRPRRRLQAVPGQVDVEVPGSSSSSTTTTTTTSSCSPCLCGMPLNGGGGSQWVGLEVEALGRLFLLCPCCECWVVLEAC